MRRSARLGRTSSSRVSRSSCSVIADRLAALRAGQRGDVDRVHLRPRAGVPAALGEPVHDRVAAVDEHDEQHAGLVGDRAPQAEDLVEAGAVAGDGQHGLVRAGELEPDRRGQREAQHPHRADEADGVGGGDARVQLGAAGGRLLQQRGVARQAVGERLEDVRGRAAARRARAAAAARGARAARCRSRARRRPRRALRRRAAGSPSTARSAGLRCASSGSCVTTAIRVPSCDQRARVVRVLAERAGAGDEHDVVGRERLPQPRAARGQVAGELRMVLREAGGAAERLLVDGAAEALRERGQRRPAGGAVGSGAGDDHGRLGGVDHGRERVDRDRVGRRGAQQPGRAERLVRLAGGGEPVVHGDDHERGAARGGGLVVGADDGAGHVLRARRLVAPHRVLAGEALEPAGEERVQREVAAVLLAGQHDERRAVLARRGQRGDGVADARRGVQQRRATARRGRCAWPAAIATTAPSCNPSTKRRSSGRPARNGTSVEPGLEKIVVRPERAQDVERRIAHRGVPSGPAERGGSGGVGSLDRHLENPTENRLVFSSIYCSAT